jgi:hypothetical protein
MALSSISAHSTGSLIDDEASRLDCSICLDPMHLADYKHPLQCEFRQCGFNFCMNCIESLIISSKDDYQEASDGNRHVKVFLHCPNCRSDLGWSIRDTLLLRKADYVLMNEHLGDSELTASQLRLKSEIHTPHVGHAIQMARKMEANFFGKQLEEEEEPTKKQSGLDARFSCSALRDDEWGVEADLLNGVHSSMRFPKNQCMVEPTPMHIDKRLLSGLDHAMSEDEQKFFTELMTAGDPSKLAEAAKQLYEIGKMAMRGVSVMQRLRKRSSIYCLIDEAEAAHAKHDAIVAQTNMFLKQQHDAVARSKQSLLQEADFMRFHPLPVRMPKYCELRYGDAVAGYSSSPFGGDDSNPSGLPFSCGPTPRKQALPVAFADDVWDGSVMDAFCKITVAPLTGKIQQHSSRLNHRGVVNVLSEGHDCQDFGKALIDVETKRIVISQVNSEAGRQGIMKGDVVTHLDGESLAGKTASELKSMVYATQNSGESDTFALVLNADKSTAEALKRRAAAVAWW